MTTNSLKDQFLNLINTNNNINIITNIENLNKINKTTMIYFNCEVCKKEIKKSVNLLLKSNICPFICSYCFRHMIH